MDLELYGKFLLALVLVLALIGVLAMIARRIGLAPGMKPTRGRRRLAVVEVLALDAKRRLVLVRRDAVEHLLLLGATEDAVVETGIPALPESAEATTLPSRSTDLSR